MDDIGGDIIDAVDQNTPADPALCSHNNSDIAERRIHQRFIDRMAVLHLHVRRRHMVRVLQQGHIQADTRNGNAAFPSVPDPHVQSFVTRNSRGILMPKDKNSRELKEEIRELERRNKAVAREEKLKIKALRAELRAKELTEKEEIRRRQSEERDKQRAERDIEKAADKR